MRIEKLKPNIITAANLLDPEEKKDFWNTVRIVPNYASCRLEIREHELLIVIDYYDIIDTKTVEYIFPVGAIIFYNFTL